MASPNCADELPDNEQPAIDQEAGSFAVAFDSEQRANGGFIATVDEVREGGWAASATDELDAASVVALDGTAASELNDFAEVEVPPIAPVDLEVEERSIAPVDLIEDRLEIQIDADVSTDDCPDGPPEEILPFDGRRRRGGARHWSPRWPMSRLQTAILVLLVVDCILVGWRPEWCVPCRKPVFLQVGRALGEPSRPHLRWRRHDYGTARGCAGARGRGKYNQRHS